MTELGVFTIDSAETFNETRRKIIRLSRAFGFDEIGATRIATGFSEIARPRPGNPAARVSAALGRGARGMALTLRFVLSARKDSFTAARRLFDSFEPDRAGNGLLAARALKYLPNPDFHASQAFLDEQREMLSRPSREELMLALKRQNDALAGEIAERRLTEERLRRSEARIQGIVEAIPDSLVMVDQAGFITFVNSQAERTFGYPRQELLGQPIAMLMPEEDKDGHEGRMALFFREGRARALGMDLDILAVRKDGTLVPVDIKLSPLATETGMQAIASIRDVTEQKKALESVKQLSQVVEQSPSSVVITDREGRILYVNPAFTSTTGYAQAEAIGQNTRLLKSGRTPPEVFSDLWATITSGKIWRGQLINRKKSGDIFWESTAIAPIFNLQNEITHFAAVKEDITERIRGEEELKRQRALLDTLVNALPLVIYAKDTAGTYQVVNDSLCALTGRPREEIVGRNAFDLFPRETAEHIHAVDQRTMDGLRLVTEEDWRAYPDGKRSLFHMTRVPIKDDEGKATGLVGAFLDITERKKAEDALHDALDVISGSIRYASRIQRAVLPPSEDFARIFSNHFIIWNPRDVVGGDIYWSARWGKGSLFVLGDCTGHGVPGAFMTLISTGALARALTEVEPGRPGLLMRRAHQIVQLSLNQHTDGGDSDDGMELGMCYVEPGDEMMLFVGARFPLFVDERGEIIEIKPDRKGIGYRAIPHEQEFSEQAIPLRPGMRLYMVSDGVFDQVGGEKRRGFGKKRFKELLESLRGVPFDLHGERIYQSLVEYQGGESRRDDVSIMGLEY